MTQLFIKIWGLRRTSTNYLEWLCHKNTEAKVFRHRFGWKHGAPGTKHETLWCDHQSFKECGDIEGVERNDLYHLIMIKNPIAWYRSFRGWKGKSENKYDPSAIRRWNESYQRWCELIDTYWNGKIIRNIDLLNDPQNTIKSLDLEHKEGFTDTNKRIGPNLKIAEDRGEFDPSLYTKRKWMDAVDNEIIAKIRNDADNNFIDRFGFVVSQ